MHEIKGQLNRIELQVGKLSDKLDTYSEVASTNKADLAWVKGTIKILFTAILAAAAGGIGYIIKLIGGI